MKIPKKPQKRAVNKKPAFLAAFVACASLTEAAKAVGIDRGVHYDWLRDDPEYVEAFKRAKPQAGDTLKDIAVHWARIGLWEPLVYQGRFQYEQRKREVLTLNDGREFYEDELPAALGSDFDRGIAARRTVTEDDPARQLGIWRRSEGLMHRLLKAFLPDEFAERGAVELTGKDGGPIEIGIVERLNAARNRLAKTKEENK